MFKGSKPTYNPEVDIDLLSFFDKITPSYTGYQGKINLPVDVMNQFTKYNE